ncbi:MAG: hypothetical protein C4543_09695 [Ignavibacteriales bacterium]|jgi:hypothetical protein|nr:MAG: hypothetical protein C4543_09695 [Ignavibacteriales bacterium]
MEYKRLTILGFAVMGLIISSMSIYVGFEYMVGHNQWLGLIIGVGFMIVGIIIYQFGKRHGLFYLLSFISNMMGVGLSITAYYVFKEYSLAFEDFMFAIIVSLLMLSGFLALTFMERVKKHIKWMTAIIIIVSLIVSLILWLSVDEFSGLSFYYLNIIYFFMVGMISVTDSLKDLSKEMAWVSLGAFLLISIIVLIVLSEGEALSGMDGIDITPSGKKKKANT